MLRKIVIRVLAGIVVLVALVLFIGALLPREHTAAVEGHYRASPTDVYELINDVANGARWRSGLTRVEVLSAPGEPLRWRETADWGTLTFVQDENVPGRRIVSRIVDEDQGFGGAWTYEIDGTSTGSVLRITERGDVSNPMFRFMSRFVFGHYTGLETYIRDVGRHFGEDVAPSRLPDS